MRTMHGGGWVEGEGDYLYDLMAVYLLWTT